MAVDSPSSSGSPSSLRDRIQNCVSKKAALVERRSRAEADLADAEAALTEAGLKPKTARAAIEKAEAELEEAVAAIEEQLGL